MKKRKRAWWFIGGFVVLCGLMFFVALSLSEHPDYKRGAEGLAEARAHAREVIVTLTWEEHREKYGYEAADDSEEWLSLQESIPVMFEEYEQSLIVGPPKWTVGAMYLQNRDWLFSLAQQIEPLRLTKPAQMKDFTDVVSEEIRYSSELSKRVCLLLLGAADVGDVKGIREAGEIAWMIVERQLEETD